MHDCPVSLLSDAVTKNALLWPITWLVAGLLLLLARPGEQSRNLALSGLSFGLAYAVVGVASDFRYFYWTQLAVQIAILLHLAHGGRLPWRLWLPVIGLVWSAGYAARYLLF